MSTQYANAKSVVLLIVSGLFLAGCAGTKPPPTVVGVYGDRPVRQTVEGSAEQMFQSRTMPYSFDEVFDAAQEAVFQKGLNVERADRQKGKIVGDGLWQAVCGSYGPCSFEITFAIYVEEISPERTKITVLTDKFPNAGHMGDHRYAASIMIQVQKVLATY